jgi:hypothetical protein
MEIETAALANFLRSASHFGAFEFEKNFDPQPYLAFANNNYIIPAVAIICYLSFCFGVRSLMEGREAFNLRTILALWNALLSTFSFLGMCRTVSSALYFLCMLWMHHFVSIGVRMGRLHLLQPR